MGALSILHWAIVLLVFGVPLWLIFRSRKGNAGGQQFGMFRDLTSLGQWMRWLFYGAFALYLAGFVSRNFLPSSDLADEVSPIDVIGAIDVAVLYASLILFLRWIYCANSNARKLGASGMAFTPGWSVGWFFVPFANFVKPYQVMREIWQTSSNPGAWKGEPVPFKIAAWWGIWCVVFAASSFGSDNPSVSRFVILGFEVLLVLLLWVQVKIMNDVRSRQTHHHARLVPAPLDTGA
jgi:hypothetical protein